MTLAAQIRIDEGVRPLPYKDSEGYWTVGIGRMIDLRLGGGLRPDEIELLQTNGKRPMFLSKRYAYQDCPDFWRIPLTDEEMDYLLNNDILNAVEDCKKMYPLFLTFSQPRKEALTNMMFNMGIKTMGQFVNTIAAINKGDWKAVQANLEKSLWFKQVGPRAVRVIKQLGESK